MKLLTGILVLIALVVPTTYAADSLPTLEQIKKSGKIRIGYRQSSPPLSFRDNEGVPIGYSIDLCIEITIAVGQELGNPEIKLDFVPVNSQNRFEALMEDKIDILCGATTKTLSRQELVDFTQLTFATGASLMSPHAKPIRTLEDLKGKKVAVTADTTTASVFESALKETGINAEIVSVDSAVEGFDLLESGKVDAFGADQVVLIGLLFTSGSAEKFGVSDVTFSYEPFALAVKRNDADFRLLANRVLSRLYRTRQIIPIYRKWFSGFSNEIPDGIAAVYQINAIPE